MGDKKIDLQDLATRLEFVERLLKLEGEWITPAQGEEIWPISKERILKEIRVAEQKRVTREVPDLIYGEHYYSTLFPFDHVPGEGLVERDKQRNTWMVNRVKFWEVVGQPLEQRGFYG